jgi:hypothetical protein
MFKGNRHQKSLEGSQARSSMIRYAGPIGRGLSKTFGYTPAFEQRLRERFRVGSDERLLVDELKSEKFALGQVSDPSSRYRDSAMYETSDGIFCKENGKFTGRRPKDRSWRLAD